MKKGDYIRVKDGTKDPDFKGNYLSGYTGYIEDIDDYNQVCILWDESTLRIPANSGDILLNSGGHFTKRLILYHGCPPITDFFSSAVRLTTKDRRLQ